MAPPRRVPAGQVLLRQGDMNDHHALVIREAEEGGTACVKITARLENGVETMLGIRMCGDVIGELTAVHGGPRSATATTCSEVIIHAIRAEFFRAFLNRHPERWLALSHTIADRLKWANQNRLDFVGYPAPVRLARVLLMLAERHGQATEGGLTPGVTLSQDELGMLIGASKHTVSQAISELKRAELIKVSYRTVVIIDLNGLRRSAEGPV
nr:Crp/Fnr family transcriptional regulator [Herbidospora mongoliensis]